MSEEQEEEHPFNVDSNEEEEEVSSERIIQVRLHCQALNIIRTMTLSIKRMKNRKRKIRKKLRTNPLMKHMNYPMIRKALVKYHFL